ncbi:MAG: hypothetical protein LBT25_08355 [Candidatus Symbiothrix sp.]|nr:hypothetical protein [Candidatus Symbiothrix sp.]
MKVSYPKEKLVKIIIPVYKNNLDSNESLSLKQCCTILAKRPIVIVKPESLDMDAICQMYPQYISTSGS